MGLNDTASSERIHIGFFGLRNSGKSSLVNRITNQNLSVVSHVAGTTTDPVRKAMELLPLGPVEIYDTAGFDDEGSLGKMRVEKTLEIMRKTDIAILVTDASKEMTEKEKIFFSEFEKRKIPHILVFNKKDIVNNIDITEENAIAVSALTGDGIEELKNRIGSIAGEKKEKKIISDKLDSGDTVILVVPIDESAPKGRLILPQQQTIRDILDASCNAVICKPEHLDDMIKSLKESPKMVITDSQVFKTVAEIVPEEIPLTSFSILFARYKGELKEHKEGADILRNLKSGDKILISEGCTHHRQCNDIGTVKMPGWIKEYTGKDIEFDFTSGNTYPEDISEYAMCIHCGGCMLNDKEMKYRIELCKNSNVPVLNYGMAIAVMHGVFERSTELFRDELV